MRAKGTVRPNGRRPPEWPALKRQAGRFVLGGIRFYQVAVSPLFGRHCRFHPTCSEYARQAIEQHGLARGGSLAVRRVLRCHPFNPGGYDPVPVIEAPGTGSQ